MHDQAASDVRIRERFLLDHRNLESLLRQVRAAFEDGDRETVAASWNSFETGLTAHMDAEERHLIPLLQRVNERAARAILEEHKHFRNRLTELGAEVDLHVIRLSTVQSFLDELAAHASHEDKVLYAWADETLDSTKRASIIDALKKRLFARASVIV